MQSCGVLSVFAMFGMFAAFSVALSRMFANVALEHFGFLSHGPGQVVGAERFESLGRFEKVGHAAFDVLVALARRRSLAFAVADRPLAFSVARRTAALSNSL